MKRGRLIHKPPPQNLVLSVVIPAHREPGLIETLCSLRAAKLPCGVVEVIIVINYSEKAPQQIKDESEKQYQELLNWCHINQNKGLSIYPLLLELPRKQAGVGLARKTGMDEAALRFFDLDKKDAPIVCLDGDSRVEPSYFIEILNFFENNPHFQAASIHYEHPLEGPFPAKIYNAIIQYELHLRYYINAQKWAGFPLAFQTIGSAMAVRAGAYVKQGGMNKRKAGEDFYFLHKFSEIGVLGEIKSTTVIPSPRTSDRVPFGTGKAVQDFMNQNDNSSLTTYHPQSFKDLSQFLSSFESLYEINGNEMERFIKEQPKAVRAFLTDQNATAKFLEIKMNTSSKIQFRKRFFRWFNAFLMMKYVHFARDHFYANTDIEKATAWLLLEIQPSSPIDQLTLKEKLVLMRKLDKS